MLYVSPKREDMQPSHVDQPHPSTTDQPPSPVDEPHPSPVDDKVSSRYLEAILEAFCFCRQWISWVLALIKSSRFSILVNGAPSEPFSPSRGIRQVDPLSPFLFVILMEGLSRIIAKKRVHGVIKGLQPIRTLPATTHQQFVDDTCAAEAIMAKTGENRKVL